MYYISMEITLFLAKFWGMLFMLLGGLSVCAGLLRKIIKLTDNHKVTVITGFITFLLGLMTVVLHNVWVMDWRVGITILGWTTLLKGLTKITFPDHVNKRAQTFKDKPRFWGGIIFFIGVWFFWMSF